MGGERRGGHEFWHQILVSRSFSHTAARSADCTAAALKRSPARVWSTEARRWPPGSEQESSVTARGRTTSFLPCMPRRPASAIVAGSLNPRRTICAGPHRPLRLASDSVFIPTTASAVRIFAAIAGISPKPTQCYSIRPDSTHEPSSGSAVLFADHATRAMIVTCRHTTDSLTAVSLTLASVTDAASRGRATP